MWIFCYGAEGGGAALHFSLISKIVERCGVGKGIEWDSSVEDFAAVRSREGAYSGFKVVKANKLSPGIEQEFLNRNAVGFYAFRDVRNILIAAADEKGEALDGYLNDGYFGAHVSHFLEWQRVPYTYRSGYEDVVADVEATIRRIQTILDLDNLSDESIADVSQAFSLENASIFGRERQWQSVFGKEQNELVEKAIGEWLLNHGYELASGNDKIKLYSYSQHGDDDYIWKFFNKKRNGLVVEVGAFDGVHFSNSYSLENIGWRSLCMEPTPSMYKKLLANRPKARCYNVAVVGDEDINEIDFLSEELGLLSGVDIDVEDVRLRYEKRGLEFKEPEKIKVKARTLNSIFRELKTAPGEIDCITIDVEGFEMDVLRGLDLDVFQPKMVVVEANTLAHKTEIIEYLNQRSYYLLTELGVNLIFVPDDVTCKEAIVVDCVPVTQIHPLGEAFTIQATTHSTSSGGRGAFLRKGLQKIKNLLKR